MATCITIRDELPSGKLVHSRELNLPGERVTVRELIRCRVFQEVKDHNLNTNNVYKGLIQLMPPEQSLNNNQAKQINWEEQFDVAVEAFENHQLLVLVGNQQCLYLDDEFDISPTTKISFVKLVLLVGG